MKYRYASYNNNNNNIKQTLTALGGGGGGGGGRICVLNLDTQMDISLHAERGRRWGSAEFVGDFCCVPAFKAPCADGTKCAGFLSKSVY